MIQQVVAYHTLNIFGELNEYLVYLNECRFALTMASVIHITRNSHFRGMKARRRDDDGRDGMGRRRTIHFTAHHIHSIVNTTELRRGTEPANDMGKQIQ